mmetsp:Transcript_18336/g.41016  ORF Transcript_18336/g.41016 Transcript_18336/m.41016 type:complete len:142 (-) Transcript_18336:272-697(-)|eukprot:CAMPEP_0181168834 /NCGR_PEP_ID=MMETSP1096-20121128/489_1 /TAXON_ID=156174 ORGANISM="Chrysochromulina ericina, Strain CCMP281" /NCGR_SAMPLE_ID=MMETSP1096 /ASSEMBLY_ACC=CAM_ASM_000453 /LENGTH=141 /DNA_ID=CAMNT_0023256245 /DNA_START=72 /DNA_END=497 /DNA_ORIENTATION=+
MVQPTQAQLLGNTEALTPYSESTSPHYSVATTPYSEAPSPVGELAVFYHKHSYSRPGHSREFSPPHTCRDPETGMCTTTDSLQPVLVGDEESGVPASQRRGFTYSSSWQQLSDHSAPHSAHAPAGTTRSLFGVGLRRMETL